MKPCPSNYLAAREHYQLYKHRLNNAERELMALFNCKTVADLENALLEKRFVHLEKIRAYNLMHQELDAADRIYETAMTLQRQKFDETFQLLDC